jgi:hypothetical protein
MARIVDRQLCLLTIYRLPFQVSGRVSDGLILDSFSKTGQQSPSETLSETGIFCLKIVWRHIDN